MATKMASQLQLGGGSTPVALKTEPKGYVAVLADRELCFWPRGYSLDHPRTDWTVRSGIYEALDYNDTSHRGDKVRVVKVIRPAKETHPCAVLIGPQVKGFWGSGAKERAERFLRRQSKTPIRGGTTQ